LPPPRVESAVLALTPLAPEEQPQPKNRERYFKLVEGVFRHRRKQLLNALGLCFSHLGADGCRQALIAAGIDPQARPSDLTQDDYVRLADVLA
jgi:16S rRNA (adenine1518-N6/adenine1519-N6)-dimethyltransferase